jgi:hypothetical protein
MLCPLWSLPLEVQMYFFLPFLFVRVSAGRYRSIAVWLLSLFAAVITAGILSVFDVLLFSPGFAEQLFQTLRSLVEAWCDRRALQALRHILRGYPLTSPLTDGWAELMSALKDVRAFAREEITVEELRTVDECVRVVERAVYRL